MIARPHTLACSLLVAAGCSAPTVDPGASTVAEQGSLNAFFALSPDQGSFDGAQAATLRALGAQMVRLQFCDWPAARDTLSAQVDAANAAGLAVYAEINYCTTYAPADPAARVRYWHDGFSDAGNAFSTTFSQAAGDIASFFRGRVQRYEIWNEPDAAPRPFGFDGNRVKYPSPSNADWNGACGDYVYGADFGQAAWAICPRQLGVLTTNAFMAIKAGDPAAEVVAGNVLFHGDDGWVAKEYWKQVESSPAVAWHINNRGRRPWDIVGLHPYGSDGGSGALQHQIGDMRSILDGVGDPARLALSEYGWSTGGEFPSTDEATDAAYLRSGMAAACQSGLAFVVWVNYVDSPGLHFGLKRADGSWKPAARAYCAAAGAPACPDGSSSSPPPPSPSPPPPSPSPSPPASSLPSCGALSYANGWPAAVCEWNGNNACLGQGAATADCDHCCPTTQLNCGTLAQDYSWSAPRCEWNGNGACNGSGPPTSDCDHCCG